MSSVAPGLSRTRKLGKFAFAAQRRPSFNSDLAHVPLSVAALLLAILLPLELDFYVGSLRLNCARVVLFTFLPVAISRIFSGRDAKLRSYDYFFIGYLTWYTLVLFLKEPLDKALQTGGIIFLEESSAYLLARVAIRDLREFLGTVKLLFVSVLIVGALAVPESLFSQHFVRNAAAALAGLPPVTWIETRSGLARAMSVFSHPIHYGAFCSSVFALIWFTEHNPARRVFRAALIAAFAFFSLSAGPLQGIGVVAVGALWERATRGIPNRVWLTLGISAGLYMLASLLTKRSPMQIIITGFLFDPASYYYRMLIWDYGIANVMKSPLIGMPMGFWERPAWMPTDSVDNFWLTIALWGGLPSLVMLVLSIVTAMRAVNRYSEAPEPAEVRRARYAWNAVIVGMCVMGASVHWWGSLAILFAVYLGMAGCLADIRERNRELLDAEIEPAPVAPRRRRSRFERQFARETAGPAPPTRQHSDFGLAPRARLDNERE
jgi:hypothetical protein